MSSCTTSAWPSPACAVLEEELHNCCVAAFRCSQQRHVVLCVHVCTMLDEDLDNVHMACT